MRRKERKGAWRRPAQGFWVGDKGLGDLTDLEVVMFTNRVEILEIQRMALSRPCISWKAAKSVTVFFRRVSCSLTSAPSSTSLRTDSNSLSSCKHGNDFRSNKQSVLAYSLPESFFSFCCSFMFHCIHCLWKLVQLWTQLECLLLQLLFTLLDKVCCSVVSFFEDNLELHRPVTHLHHCIQHPFGDWTPSHIWDLAEWIT